MDWSRNYNSTNSWFPFIRVDVGRLHIYLKIKDPINNETCKGIRHEMQMSL